MEILSIDGNNQSVVAITTRDGERLQVRLGAAAGRAIEKFATDEQDLVLEAAWRYTQDHPDLRIGPEGVIWDNHLAAVTGGANDVPRWRRERGLRRARVLGPAEMPDGSNVLAGEPPSHATAEGSTRLFGHVPGVSLGATFSDRAALAEAGVHRPLQAGISGRASEGADSIVVSGGYEDDEDDGDVLIYTGHGGQRNSVQVADQEWTRGNAALARSLAEGLPVRVVRGAGGDPEHSPATGYRYDGLFVVDEAWLEAGRSGFQICRFRLRRLGEDGTPLPAPATATSQIGATGPATRVEATTQRLVRSTAVARSVKRLHHDRCQVCGETVELRSGSYSEGAHIRPLGRPHDGPDVAGNVLCLCPNDHVRFDLGAIYVDQDWNVRETTTDRALGPLRRVATHAVESGQLAYHRERFASTSKENSSA